MKPTTLRLLLVAINPTDVTLPRAALEHDRLAHYHVTIAESLEEGLTTITRESFDAILLNLDRPDYQGALATIVDEEGALRAVRAGAPD